MDQKKEKETSIPGQFPCNGELAGKAPGPGRRRRGKHPLICGLRPHQVGFAVLCSQEERYKRGRRGREGGGVDWTPYLAVVLPARHHRQIHSTHVSPTSPLCSLRGASARFTRPACPQPHCCAPCEVPSPQVDEGNQPRERKREGAGGDTESERD
ncbi:hypothetical protein E2562_019901 [Oryza meyeriana var. granulata]|uniref:Uncharacterized protein n=1 Tax=Oryza meyeriana var. granulata TaxID=110450 RepID=A0A6G1EXB8_9ORYZ|nr:hypothetical protein E2562_019901 [Oryza meyeriana var. granulata]